MTCGFSNGWAGGIERIFLEIIPFFVALGFQILVSIKWCKQNSSRTDTSPEKKMVLRYMLICTFFFFVTWGLHIGYRISTYFSIPVSTTYTYLGIIQSILVQSNGFMNFLIYGIVIIITICSHKAA